MEPKELDAPEVLETPETVEEEAEAPEAEQTDEEKAQLRQELEELKKKNAQLYERAKKSEVKKTSNDTGLSPKDYLALTSAQITPDDFDEVVRVSKILEKPIHEAVKDSTMQAILQKRAEERRTAEATAIKGSPRAVQRNTGEDFLKKAESTGEIPEKDEDLVKLIKARAEAKQNERRRQ